MQQRGGRTRLAVVAHAQARHAAEEAAEEGGVAVQTRQQLRLLLHAHESGVGDGGGEGRGGRGEAVAGAREALVVHNLARPHAEAADGAQRGVQRAHHHVNVRHGEACVLQGAAARLPQRAEGAALVHQQAVAEALLEGADRAQRCDVARVAVQALHLRQRGGARGV